jgi:hypothetical protein
MTEMGLWVPATVIRELPATVRETLITALTSPTVPGEPVAPQPPETANNGELTAPDLSVAQATEFFGGCGPKVQRVIRTIAEGPTRYFQVADLAKAVNTEVTEMAGIWAGITKRTRTILKDRNASLFAWDAMIIYDNNNNYTDQRGWISEMTYRSFRRALNIG